MPGVSIAVIAGGRIEWARAYGVAEVGGTRADTTTLFHAASISKVVTTTAALRLVELHRLDLGQDVNERRPGRFLEKTERLETLAYPPGPCLLGQGSGRRGSPGHRFRERFINLRFSMSPRYVVTLVHGTWAPNAPWTQRASAFCEKINEQLDGAVEFNAFAWSGGNSHADRLIAARSLASELRTRCDGAPDAKHFVVAHSHGGNVALYALRDVELQRRLTGLICLATPFMFIEARNLARALTPFAIMFIMLAGILLSVMYLSVAAAIVAVPVLLFEHSGNSGWWGAVVGVLLVPAFFGFDRWFTPRWRIAVDALLDAVKRLRRRVSARQRGLLRHLAVPEQIATPIYTVRSESDEALSGLTIMHAISDLPYRAFQLFERAQNALFEMWFSFGIGMVLLRLGFEWVFGWNSQALILEALALFVLGSIACFFLMPAFNSIRFHRLGFGEPLGLGFLLNISVGNVPPRKRRRANRVGDGIIRIDKGPNPQPGAIVVSRTIQRPWVRSLLRDRRLLHSAIYSDPEAISGIAVWIRQTCA